MKSKTYKICKSAYYMKLYGREIKTFLSLNGISKRRFKLFIIKRFKATFPSSKHEVNTVFNAYWNKII